MVVVPMLRISRSMDHMRLKIDDCCGRSLTGGNRFDGLVKLDTIVDSEMSSIVHSLSSGSRKRWSMSRDRSEILSVAHHSLHQLGKSTVMNSTVRFPVTSTVASNHGMK